MVIQVQKIFRTSNRQGQKGTSLRCISKTLNIQRNNIESYKKEAPTHIKNQTPQNNSILSNKNTKSKKGME
jgi:hypothetical protein